MDIRTQAQQLLTKMKPHSRHSCPIRPHEGAPQLGHTQRNYNQATIHWHVAQGHLFIPANNIVNKTQTHTTMPGYHTACTELHAHECHISNGTEELLAQPGLGLLNSAARPAARHADLLHPETANTHISQLELCLQ